MTRADDWIEWNGGKCPVEGETRVFARRRDGKIEGEYWVNGIPAKALRWSSHLNAVDIIAYRIVQP